MDFRSFLLLFACQDFLGEFGPPIISKTMLRACCILSYRRVYITLQHNYKQTPTKCTFIKITSLFPVAELNEKHVLGFLF